MQFSLVVLLAIAVTVSGAPATAKALQVLVISKCVADLAPTDSLLVHPPPPKTVQIPTRMLYA
ncbi:hypothetical protein K438DRAFT_1976987 [Mycena galopus ATCC 62051]|nr:hypothetical protein K438DRAFT_1976987 [Mycena galopus ATCC 62051]